MSSRKRLAGSKSLSFALVTLLALPPIVSAMPRGTVLPLKLSSHAAVATSPAQAGFVYKVNTTGDGERWPGTSCDSDPDTPGEQCTLRAAIQGANSLTNDSSIEILIPLSDPGCDTATGRCVINLTKALPNLNTNMSIKGPGPDKLTVRRGTGGDYPVFLTSAAVTLSGMTISNGKSDYGGGIRNSGGTVNVSNCTISHNSGVPYGGGIGNVDGGTVNISNSTINNNFASGVMDNDDYLEGAGGGVNNNSGCTMNITNSTISSNIAGLGGGIGNDGTMNVTNSTITDNVATSAGQFLGGGVYSFDNPLEVNFKSSIIASNKTSSSGPNIDIQGSFTSSGFNLIGVADGGTGFTHSTDLTGTAAAPLDPKLDPEGLQNNGGPTRTIALLPASPAIDKGTSNALTGALSTDQRGTGFPRTYDDPAVPNASVPFGSDGDGTDIGAFESRPTSILLFSSATYSVSEATASVTITVKRTGSLAAAVTVNYGTSDGTATAGQDYTAACGTLSFAANQASKTFTVPIINDTVDEANETVNLTLGSPPGAAVLGKPHTAVLTIADNDLPSKLSINNAAVTEGNSGSLNATFTVTLSAASSQTVSVNYATADGTAKAPADYATKSATLTFTPGQTSKQLTVAVRGDLLDEAGETFFVSLSGAVNATFADAQGQGTITDNDAAPSITIDNRSVTEPDTGAINAVFTVKLSAASGQTVSVKYATGGGTAAAGTDYTALALTTLIFSPGQTSKTVTVQVKGDLLKEANETFFLNLSGAVNATIADAQGLGTIVNDD